MKNKEFLSRVLYEGSNPRRPSSDLELLSISHNYPVRLDGEVMDACACWGQLIEDGWEPSFLRPPKNGYPYYVLVTWSPKHGLKRFKTSDEERFNWILSREVTLRYPRISLIFQPPDSWWLDLELSEWVKSPWNGGITYWTGVFSLDKKISEYAGEERDHPASIELILPLKNGRENWKKSECNLWLVDGDEPQKITFKRVWKEKIKWEEIETKPDKKIFWKWF